MSTISKIVQKVLKNGYLSVEVEEQLRQLFKIRYSLDDIEALTRLQKATTSGLVKQESRLLVRN